MESVRIDSEIGKLRRVIIHNPGSEIEAMTPREAERDLYNDIIPLFAVQREYAKLRDFLHKVTKHMSLRICSRSVLPMKTINWNF
jgi:Arginine deiminase